MTGTLIERLWESDEASRLTNEAARKLESNQMIISEIVDIISEYHAKLDRREHGGVAAHWAINRVERLVARLSND